jgi:hypothetical protein
MTAAKRSYSSLDGVTVSGVSAHEEVSRPTDVKG